MSNSVLSHRRQPMRLPCPWDSPGKNIGVGCHFLLQCMKVKSESEVAPSCPTLGDPMDCSLPGSSAMGFSRQEYRSGVPLPSPSEILAALKTNGNSPQNTVVWIENFKSEPKCTESLFINSFLWDLCFSNFWESHIGRSFQASSVAQRVKNLPAMLETQETRVRSLGQEDPLEEEMVTHSRILAWKLQWTEEPSTLQCMGSQSQTPLWAEHTHFSNDF